MLLKQLKIIAVGLVALGFLAGTASVSRARAETAKDDPPPNTEAPAATSPDDKVRAMGRDKQIMVVDAATGKTIMEMKGHAEKVLALSYGPDGKVLASASKDGAIIFWDAATGKPCTAVSCPAKSVTKNS